MSVFKLQIVSRVFISAFCHGRINIQARGCRDVAKSYTHCHVVIIGHITRHTNCCLGEKTRDSRKIPATNKNFPRPAKNTLDTRQLDYSFRNQNMNRLSFRPIQYKVRHQDHCCCYTYEGFNEITDDGMHLEEACTFSRTFSTP